MSATSRLAVETAPSRYGTDRAGGGADCRQLCVGFFSRRVRLRSVLELSDLLAMNLAFSAATLLAGIESRGTSALEIVSARLKLVNFLLFLVLLGGWHACFRAFRLYDASRPLLERARLLDAAKATSLGVGVVSSAAILFHIVLVNPGFIASFWALAIGSVAALRIALKWSLESAAGAALLRRRALIAGTGPRALRLARQLEEDVESPVRIVGFVDEHWPGMNEFRRSQRPVVSDLNNLTAFLREHVIDEIVLALPMSVLGRCRTELFAACREHGVTLRFPVSALVDVPVTDVRNGVARDEILLNLYHGTIGGWPLLAKRAFDLALGIPLFLLAIPVLAAATVGIKLTSPGPAFFTQERVGFNKRRFRIYKLRTMVADAEIQLKEIEHLNETGGATFKVTHDPRITRFGRLLRSFSIDELPQLLNVLKGEMSLVGPRPLPLRDVECIERDSDRRRCSVLPGLTGLWQVSGRSSLPFERLIELDLQYIDGWSFALDLQILARTLPAVLLRSGAK